MTSTTPQRHKRLGIPVLAIDSALVVAVIGSIVTMAIASATRADGAFDKVNFTSNVGDLHLADSRTVLRFETTVGDISVRN